MTPLNSFLKFIRLFLVVIVMPIGGAMAQTDPLSNPGKGELEDIEVLIRKDKDIVLPTANRNFQKIRFTPETENLPGPDINYGDYKIGLKALDPNIRINKLKQEPLEKYYGSYLKAGIGNYLNTYLEAFTGNKREDKGYFNAQLRHMGFANGPVDNSGSSQNNIALNAGAFNNGFLLKGSLGYDYQAYNFYGFENDSLRNAFESNNPDIPNRQHFNRVDVGLGIAKSNPKDYFHFDWGLHYNMTADNFDQTEHNINSNIIADYDLNVDQKIIVDGRYLLSAFQVDSFNVNRHLISIAPQFQKNNDQFTLRGGLRFAYENDSSLSGEVHLYPILHFEYSIDGDNVVPYAGVNGDIDANNLNSLSQVNPQLQRLPWLSHSNTKLNLYGGIKLLLGGMASFDGRLSYKTVDNLQLLLNDPADESKFLSIYDQSNTTIFSANAQLAIKPVEDFEAGINLEYNSYSMGEADKAWHLPALESHLFGIYKLRNKILLHADIYIINGIFALSPKTLEPVKLDPIIDLNLKGEYLFSNRVSTFVGLRNILSQTYQRYLNYDSRGIQVMAGLTYTF